MIYGNLSHLLTSVGEPRSVLEEAILFVEQAQEKR